MEGFRGKRTKSKFKLKNYVYWSKTIIELKNENGKKRAILLKHRSMPKKELVFEIKDKGIFKKGCI